MTSEPQAMPTFLYGTAWKEDQTQRLVELALEQGFRGIDTANQRKHYYEAAVGQGIQAAIARGIVRRADLFLQTKYTFQAGQDHRLPYDPHAPIAQQVEQSIASSLEHLGVEGLDSYILHGPNQRVGLGRSDWEAWRAMEAAHDRGLTRRIGVSNVTLEQLQALCDQARVPPSFVQNRCYAITGWDREVRALCRQRGIVYQGFSLLTANRQVLAHPPIVNIANQRGMTPAQLIFRFALDVGMLPLTGTTDAEHMRQDLRVPSFALAAEEVKQIEQIAER
jgi:diketogulonate reductase-like aldo/keto reductase